MTGDQGVRSLSRGLQILAAINQCGSMTIMEAARGCDLPFATTSRIFDTLVKSGMIERETSRKHFRPTALVRSLSLGYDDPKKFQELAYPTALSLTRATGWPAAICTRVGLKMMVRVATHAKALQTLRTFNPGHAFDLTSTSAGRVFLAFCTEQERQETLDKLEIEQGEQPADLDELLDGIRRRGFGIQVYAPTLSGARRSLVVTVPIWTEGICEATLSLQYRALMPDSDDETEIIGVLPHVQEAAAYIGAQLDNKIVRIM